MARTPTVVKKESPRSIRDCGASAGGVLCELETWCASRGMPAPIASAFASGWRPNRYSRGNVLFYQGNEPFALFFICSGRVKLVRAEDGGRHQIVRIIRAPNFLGERSLVAGEPYAATAEVMDDARICVIDSARFFRAWADRPELPRMIARQLAAKLGEAEAHATDLSMRTIRERLAKHFSEESTAASDGGRFVLSETRQEIAELLGTSPEVISRTIAELEEKDLVEVDGRSVRVRDEKRLRRVARLPAGPLDINQADSRLASSNRPRLAR